MKKITLPEEYSRTLRLAIPVTLSQAGQLVVQLVDNAMVGRLGATPLAGVAFGGTMIFFLFIFGMGIALGSTPLIGEMFAQGRHRISASYLQNSVLLYLLVGIGIFCLQWAAIPLLHHLGQPREVVEAAIPYYKYLMWSMIPFMLFSAFKQFLEGVGNTRVAMAIIILSNLINVLFNWLLIYGKCGFPAMGAAGAGLATLISRICTPILIIAYFLHNPSFRRYLAFCNLRGFSVARIRSLLEVGLPISAQMTLEGGVFAITGVMMGWISTVALAANQIAIVMSNTAFMIVLSIASATTIRVSHAYGVNDPAAIRRIASSSYRIGLVWNSFTILVFVLLRHWLPMVFTADAEVIRTTANLLIFVALFQISDGLQCISVGILRGMQDVRATVVIAFISYVVINFLVGYICAFVFGFGPEGLWLGYIFGLSIAAYLLNRRYRRLIARTEGAIRS